MLFENEECITDAQILFSGVFWVIADDAELDNYKLLAFKIPCDINGNPTGIQALELNAKSGRTYNHKKLWEDDVRNNSEYKPYNRKPYDYYPRGRVEIANSRATIYLSPHLDSIDLTEEIKREFGLRAQGLSGIRVLPDTSVHYRCYLDREDEKQR